MRWILSLFILLLITTPALALEDVTPPAVTALTFPAGPYNCAMAMQPITFNFTITDADAGFDHAYFYLASPTATQKYHVYMNSTHRTSGTAQNGTYQVTAKQPQFSAVGWWRIESIRLLDVANNTRTLLEADLAASGITTTYQVQ